MIWLISWRCLVTGLGAGRDGHRGGDADTIEGQEPRLEPAAEAPVVALLDEPMDRVREAEGNAERGEECPSTARAPGTPAVDHDVADVLVDEVERIGQRAEEEPPGRPPNRNQVLPKHETQEDDEADRRHRHREDRRERGRRKSVPCSLNEPRTGAMPAATSEGCRR